MRPATEVGWKGIRQREHKASPETRLGHPVWPEEGRAVATGVRAGKEREGQAGENGRATKDPGKHVKELGQGPAGPETGDCGEL